MTLNRLRLPTLSQAATALAALVAAAVIATVLLPAAAFAQAKSELDTNQQSFEQIRVIERMQVRTLDVC